MSISLHTYFKSGKFWQSFKPYENITPAVFNDSKWQFKNTISRLSDLENLLQGLVLEKHLQSIQAGIAKAPMALRITPYLLSLINWQAPFKDPIFLQFIPHDIKDIPDHPELAFDSLDEKKTSPVKGIVHRYQDRVLFLSLSFCPVYCAYCTRSYAVGPKTQSIMKAHIHGVKEKYRDMFDYIKDMNTIEDVIVSGGDTYMLKPKTLYEIGHELLSIPHVRRIRFATKGIAVMPMRILTNSKWYNAIKRLHQEALRKEKDVCIHTHFNHPNEITDITRKAAAKLHRDGITVRNQSVLLRKINDDAITQITLCKKLSYINIQPYYVYMHDLVPGAEKFRTRLQRGLDIAREVKGVLAGFNTPLFVVDLPGGGGKRDIFSYHDYDHELGISIYDSPSVSPGKYFYYYDPIELLSDTAQQQWSNPENIHKAREQLLQKVTTEIMAR